MEKKVLKMYEAPACEVVELKIKSSILAGSPAGGGSEDIPGDNIDPGFGS
jgi:hypothetical protein